MNEASEHFRQPGEQKYTHARVGADGRRLRPRQVEVLNPELDDEQVQAHIRALIAADRESGHLAELVWDSLTAGEGPAVVTLAGLQNWLWWLLPKRSSDEPELWAGAAAAGATLFDRLGAVRYAALCRSETTRNVFTAWNRSRSDGLKATRAALAASGIEPPDLADFVWGSLFGSWEAQARDAVELALESALDQGRLEPGIRGWQAVARSLCAGVIDTDHPEGIGQTWRTLVLSERAEAWTNSPRPQETQPNTRSAMANRFLATPAPPDAAVVSDLLAPLAWLAGICRDGLTLTAANYLPPVHVRDAVERFDWSFWGSSPRTEADIFQLEIVRDTAAKLGLVRRRHRTLATTKQGLTILDNEATWWQPFVTTLGGRTDYQRATAEALAVTMLGGAIADLTTLLATAGTTLDAQGWRTADGTISEDHHRWGLSATHHRWQVWKLADYVGSTWESGPDGPRQIHAAKLTLTDAGRLALSDWLHQRITGPRSRL